MARFQLQPLPLVVTSPVLTGTQLNGTQSAIGVTFIVTVTTPLTNGTLISNTADVTFLGSPVITTSNPVTHIVESMPVLSITKVADPVSGSEVNPGDTITYSLRITNSGNANATNVVVSDTIPANTSYVFGSADASAGSSAIVAGGALRITTPLLAGEGGVMTGTFRVQVTSPLTDGTIIRNTASVTSTEVPTITLSEEVTHVVRSAPVLSITKVADPVSGSEVSPNDLITYTIRVSNTGNANATNVVVSDTLPLFTTFVSSDTTSGLNVTSLSPLQASVPFLSAPSGVEVLTITMRVTTPLTDGTIIENTASVTSTEIPTVTFSGLVTHVVRSAPVLSITKSAEPASPGPVRPDDIITYTISVRNLGDANATNVLITDTIPANTNSIAGSVALTGTGGASGFNFLPGLDPRQFSVDFLPAPSGIVTASFQVRVTIPLTNGTILTNTAQVTSTEVSTVSLSNEVTHTVVSSPVLEISKHSDPAPGSSVRPK